MFLKLDTPGTRKRGKPKSAWEDGTLASMDEKIMTTKIGWIVHYEKKERKKKKK